MHRPHGLVLVAALAGCSSGADSTPPEPAPARPEPDGPSLANWRVAGEAPFGQARFGMTVGQVRGSAPLLVDALHGRVGSVRLQTQWPEVAQARWSLDFHFGGLAVAFARFPDETSLRAAIGDWGPPAIDSRWEFWFDESTRTRAAFSECHDHLSGPLEYACVLEFMPYQTVDELLDTLFPSDGTVVGRRVSELGSSTRFPDGSLLVALPPLPTTLWLQLEVQTQRPGGGRITAYRLGLADTYHPPAVHEFREAVETRVGPFEVAKGYAEVSHAGQPVRLRTAMGLMILTVGQWSD